MLEQLQKLGLLAGSRETSTLAFGPHRLLPADLAEPSVHFCEVFSAF